jgi:hypothetical protein
LLFSSLTLGSSGWNVHADNLSSLLLGQLRLQSHFQHVEERQQLDLLHRAEKNKLHRSKARQQAEFNSTRQLMTQQFQVE